MSDCGVAFRAKGYIETPSPTRAAGSVSDSVRHSCSSFRCAIRSVSTCLPRGNLVDGLLRASSLLDV